MMSEKEKTRDIWDKLQISAPFLSSFLIGVAGIYFTSSYNDRQQEQTRIQQAAQIKLDSLKLQTQTIEAQAKIQAAQLEAMTKLAPYLSSRDRLKRDVGYAILQSVDSVSHLLKNSMRLSFSEEARTQHTGTKSGDLSVYGLALNKIRENIAMATNLALPYKERIGAYDNVVKLALDKTRESQVQQAAAVALENIRNSPNSPLLGIGYNIDDFKKYVDTLTLEAWRPSYVVLHQTYLPNLKTSPDGFKESTIVSLVKFYTETQGWKGAPHLFVDDHKIWILNPLVRPGIHSHSWNKTSIGVSLLGDYNVEKVSEGRGKVVLDNAIAAIAILEQKFNIVPDSLKMHYEDKRTRKNCPGANIDKSMVISQTRLKKGSSGL